METMATTATMLGGNTKPPAKPKPSSQNRHKNWCFTWNNYENQWDSIIQQQLYPLGKVYCQQEEAETGTKHIQGCIQLKSPKNLEGMKKTLNNTVHWEPTINKQASIDYCTDKIKRRGIMMSNDPNFYEKISFKIGAYIKREFKPKGWQTDVILTIGMNRDNRTIYWYYDLIGGTGKTELCLELARDPNILLLTSGKASDIKHTLVQEVNEHGRNIQVVLFDLTRSQEQFFSYQLIEEIKNGYIYSGKYESGIVRMDPPHIFIFANFTPDQKKLSLDRWQIQDITPGIIPLSKNTKIHIIDSDSEEE